MYRTVCRDGAQPCPTAFVAGGGAAGGLSADDLRAALRAAEDEADVAAAATAEKEAEAEMAEFTNEPPPEELKDEDLEGEDDTKTGEILCVWGGGEECLVAGIQGGWGNVCLAVSAEGWG